MIKPRGPSYWGRVTVADALLALLKHLEAATGSDRRLDAEIAACFDPDRTDGGVDGEAGDPPDYTASVDLCIGLVERVLPGWHWHVGYGAKGILPYATVSRDEALFEGAAGTVPIALLSALLKACAARGRDG